MKDGKRSIMIGCFCCILCAAIHLRLHSTSTKDLLVDIIMIVQGYDIMVGV